MEEEKNDCLEKKADLVVIWAERTPSTKREKNDINGTLIRVYSQIIIQPTYNKRFSKDNLFHDELDNCVVISDFLETDRAPKALKNGWKINVTITQLLNTGKKVESLRQWLSKIYKCGQRLDLR